MLLLCFSETRVRNPGPVKPNVGFRTHGSLRLYTHLVGGQMLALPRVGRGVLKPQRKSFDTSLFMRVEGLLDTPNLFHQDIR